MKDKVKEEHVEGSAAIQDLKKLSENYEKLNEVHTKEKAASEERHKIMSKKYKKT